MNIFRAFEARVGQALGRLAEGGKIPAGLDASRVLVEPPRDAAHGDLATNAALVLAKEARMNPRALAELLASVERLIAARRARVTLASLGAGAVQTALRHRHLVLVPRRSPSDG